jgi:hypothetical protein
MVGARLLEVLGYGGQRELMNAVGGNLSWSALRAGISALPARERRHSALRMLLTALEGARLSVPLVLRPLRPGNRPEARLKGAAALASRYAAEGLLGSLAGHFPEAAAGRSSRLVASLTVEGLIGRPRALEILTNAVLPVLGASGEPDLAEAIYRALPLPARYGSVKHIHAALDRQVTLNARRQQGMLYLLKQYCSQGGCGKCPLS